MDSMIPFEEPIQSRLLYLSRVLSCVGFEAKVSLRQEVAT